MKAIYAKIQSRCVFISAGHVRASGATNPEEVTAKTSFGVYPQELAAHYRADKQEIMRSGRPLVGREELQRRRGGGGRWRSITKAPREAVAGRWGW